jgi:hypothetical protein
MITTFFRPSSHSDDYSLIATFETVETAKRAMAAVGRLLKNMVDSSKGYHADWMPDEARLFRQKEVVTFAVNTAGDLKYPVAALKQWTPKKLEEYINYQELRVTVTLPLGMNAKTAALILGRDDVEMIRWLTKHAGKPQVKTEEKSQTLTWTYKGGGIYDDANELHLDYVIPLANHKCWTVTLLNG